MRFLLLLRTPNVMEQIFARAYAAHRDGRLDDAERGYRETLTADPSHVDALHLLGVLCHQQGQHAKAVDLVRRAADLRPDDAALQLNLGNALKALGQLDGAIDHFRNALTLAPDFPLAHYNLGNAYSALERHEDALDAFARAVRLQPDNASARNNYGNALYTLGRHEEAAAAFRHALQLRPAHAGTHNNLGMALNALGDARGALAEFRTALQIEPRFVAAYFNLGNTLDAIGEPGAAILAFEAALALQAHFAPALLGLGSALAALGRYDDATLALERAVGVDPKFALAWFALGTTHHALGQYEAALRAFDEALRARPDLAAAHLNRALVRLTLGDFARGLPEYEWRLDPAARNALSLQADMRDMTGAPGASVGRNEAPGAQASAGFGAQPVLSLAETTAGLNARIPRWNGEPLADRTLLVRAEQGLGDTLQFMRFIPLIFRTPGAAGFHGAAWSVVPRGARVIFEVQPSLVPLIAYSTRAWSDVTVIAQNPQGAAGAANAPRADFQCPLLSLPLQLGVALPALPTGTAGATGKPYLSAPPAYRRKWRGSLGGQSRRKIGIVWSGRIQKRENRTLPLVALDPLFALSGIDWLVLQPDLSDADVAALAQYPHASPIYHFGGPDRPLDDFADTAAIVERLDAVVSIDTSIAHLAGALGKPLWLMLPFAADWRWAVDTDRSPWYPQARLVRQPRPGAWGEVVQTIAQALQEE